MMLVPSQSSTLISGRSALVDLAQQQGEKAEKVAVAAQRRGAKTDPAEKMKT